MYKYYINEKDNVQSSVMKIRHFYLVKTRSRIPNPPGSAFRTGKTALNPFQIVFLLVQNLNIGITKVKCNSNAREIETSNNNLKMLQATPQSETNFYLLEVTFSSIIITIVSYMKIMG